MKRNPGRISFSAAIGACACIILSLSFDLCLAIDFKTHPVFSKLIGEWAAEGELTVAADGSKIPITESWEGKINDSGGFSINGQRNLGGEDQEYSWEFSYNVTTEIFECEYTHTGMDQPLRFDVSISPDELAMTMRSPFGDQGELVVAKTLAGDGQALDVTVQILDAQGQVAVSGPVKHQRKTESGPAAK